MRRFFGTAALAAAALLSPLFASAQGTYYSPDLKNARTLADIGFTAIDANGDGNTWAPNGGVVTFRNLDGASCTAVDKYPIFIGANANDDWMLTPGIRFEAGKTYKGHILMCKTMFAAVGEVLEMKMGTEKSASGMNVTILPKSELIIPEFGGNSLWTFEFEISVPTTGDYYIGFHCIGKPAVKVGLAELIIENGISTVTPEAVSDIEFIRDATDPKKVTIEFTAPSKAKDGSDLTSLSKIEINRNGDLLTTIQNPVPGARQSYTTTVAVNGLYTFSVQAFTANGGGDIASGTTFVGVNTPSQVTDIKAANTGNKSATISWEAPTVDKDGYPILDSYLKYDVYRTPLYSSERTLVGENVTVTKFEDTLSDNDENAEAGDESPTQQFYIYSVVAKTSEGSASAVSAIAVPMGEPYETPYAESFNGGRASKLFTTTSLQGNTRWSVTNTLDDVNSIDGSGLAYLDGQIGGTGAYLTGLIDLSAMSSPTLSYYTYNIAGADPADNELQVVVNATDGTSKTFDFVAPELYWNKTILPLDEFAGKTVTLTFVGKRNNNTYLCLDAIEISNIFMHDLKAAAIRVPAKVHTDEPFTVTVDVVNAGSTVSGDYSVELYCDGSLADTYEATALGVGEYDYVAFTRVHGILSADTAVYSATVVYAQDSDESNNATEEVETIVRKNSYPVVTDLSGSDANGAILLTWSEPSTDKAQPYEVTEDFENYTSWANSNVGDWIFVDRDQAVIAGFNDGEQTIEMPGIPSYSQQSWWVFDNSTENFNNGSFATLSGNKFLASMVSGIQGQGFVQNDDWAISPALYGGAQTITVNARSYSLAESDWESLEVLYSTGSLNPDDFVSIRTEAGVPSEFTEYEFDLPDGAERFAIRNISFGKMMLMVDDVTYIPVGDPAAFSINGYNVYRDGVKINDVPVEENEYTDSAAPEGNHTYNVTVIYSAGESRFSNDWGGSSSSVAGLDAESTPAEYYDLQGIRVTNPLPGNIYILKIGNKAIKVIK